MTVLIILVSVLVLGAVTLVVSACRLSSRISQQQRDADAWREEYARVTRMRDGYGRR